MSIKDKLQLKRKIYVIGYNAERCRDWMEREGFLTENRRDPRVIMLLTTEQLQGIHESSDIHFQFLMDWSRGRSQEFKNTLWAHLPHVMQSNHVH